MFQSVSASEETYDDDASNEPAAAAPATYNQQPQQAAPQVRIPYSSL